MKLENYTNSKLQNNFCIDVNSFIHPSEWDFCILFKVDLVGTLNWFSYNVFLIPESVIGFQSTCFTLIFTNLNCACRTQVCRPLLMLIKCKKSTSRLIRTTESKSGESVKLEKRKFLLQKRRSMFKAHLVASNGLKLKILRK